MVAFNLIQNDVRTPETQIEFDSSGSSVPPSQPHVALIIGQRLASGTVLEGVVKTITSDTQADEFFGQGSQLANMIKAWRSQNNATSLKAVALDDDGAGVAATKTITFTGTATEAGAIRLWVHQTPIDIPVEDADDATAVADALTLAAATTEEPDLQMAIANTLGVATATARNLGEGGNDIDIRTLYFSEETIPAGITVAIADGVAGATNPDVQTALTAIGDTDQFNTIVMPWTDATNMTTMEIELEDRWKPDRQNDGLCFTGFIGTFSETQTFGDGRNSHMLSTQGFGPILMTPWEGASMVAGIDAFVNGISPARPRQNRTIVGMFPPAEGADFTKQERNLLLFDGISTSKRAAGGRMKIERLITMSQVNDGGFPTIAYLNVTKVRTLSAMRFEIRALIAQKYPDWNLAPDGTQVAPGSVVVTPTTIKADLLGLYKQWEAKAWAVNFDAFKSSLIVVINSVDKDRLDIQLHPDVIGALRFVAGKMVFA